MSKFDTAVSYVQGLPKDGPVQPDNDTKLEFYSYYKLATVGSLETDAIKSANPRPGMLDFVGKAKWDAWKAASEKNHTPEQAKEAYVAALLKFLKGIKNPDAGVEEIIRKLEA
ncbi:hypothetical protein BOTBODRAFT_27927 [Botryobasidium botryosum FD-172 SS1]|uniref:ACB domain-containing protein n=1 Tax=Botryobasidium botryosum (strain FD-172 SS1) TaxID=930990 RepID=A0A067MUT9_BOTB1|nr:hypothetical protein BOTBODRAFT_27927 [Botryobasidium botryosum FD-172 SS1]